MTLIKNNVKTVNPTEDLLKAPYGLQGANIISNTAAHYGDWYCIVSIADGTTVDFSTSATAVNWQENGAVPSSDLDLITGVPYYGDFSAIQLVDGSVIAYNK